MPRKRKPKAPSAATLARQKARATIGTVPAARVVPDPRHKPEKHKRDLAKNAPTLTASREAETGPDR